MRGGFFAPVVALALVSACGSATPTTSAPLRTPETSASAREDSPFAAYRAEVQSETEELSHIEWDFHTAVLAGSDHEARGHAEAAVQALDAITGLRPPAGATECERAAVADAAEFIEPVTALWEERSDGESFPSSDEIDLFFAFYGATKPWVVLLEQADTHCAGSEA